jgi:thymidine kinase
MFGNKTSKLLIELERLKYKKKNFVVFKPSIDDRYSKTDVVTHGGWTVPAITVQSGIDVLAELDKVIDQKVDVVAVDEAFMIDGIADVLVWLFRNGISIIVSTLDLSSKCKPFKEVQLLTPWATRIEKCSAVCTVCGADANYTYKNVVSDQEIEVGGCELYEPRCWRCHPLVNGMIEKDE